MPTPSSSRPEPQSPRSFTFSTCPDPDEHPQALQSTPRAQPTPAPPSLLPTPPSSWRPHLPPAYAAEAGPREDTRMNDDADTPSSTTMSPGPHADTPSSATLSPGPHSDSPRDVEMEHESEGIMTATYTDDGPKQADLDDDMVGSTAQPIRHAPPVPATAGASTGDGPGVSRPPSHTVVADLLERRKQKTGGISRVSGDLYDANGWGPLEKGPRWVEDSGLVGLGNEYSHKRLIPVIPSTYLRPGSRFSGTQESERQRYDVEVEIKHVDLRESFLCGYLKIQGLTDDHPTLTTYFEGEIIGTKYGFITQHPSWGATERIDLSHWGKFTAFRPFHKQARKGGQIAIKDVAQRENIFMRWKEHFLVPDHRVRTINGASFEGFYYICFNQVRGEVSGIYFHSKSEKFQRLELKHVNNKGCYGAMEFR